MAMVNTATLSLQLNVTSRAAGSVFEVSSSIGSIQQVPVPDSASQWQLLDAMSVTVTSPFTTLRIMSLTPAFSSWDRQASTATLNGIVVIVA